MSEATTASEEYLKTLLDYYEAEVMGEAYFLALADLAGDPIEKDKLALLAAVESHAAAAVVPLLQKHGLTPRSEAELKATGKTHVERHEDYDWMALVDYMLFRYPGYVDDFNNLERMAPKADLPELEFLTLHEVVAIDFANMEKAGDPDSQAPLHRYLSQDAATAGSS